MDNLKIVPFNKDYKPAFEFLNRAWIEEYFVMEEEDLKTLQNPESYVLEKGGEVFFAILDGNFFTFANFLWKTIFLRYEPKYKQSYNCD